jgi:YhcH/YjgK/YiaL family protein
VILDALIHADRYAALHPRFARGFEFLRRPDLATLADGTHRIEGDALFAMVSHPKTKPPDQRVWEAHRRYIDIQYIVSGGVERMGWSLLDRMTPSKPYDAQGDYSFFTGEACADVDVSPGHFVIFFPHDAHAPCLAPPGEPPRVIHKVVLKVAAQ